MINSARLQEALCILRRVEIAVYLIRYTSYWHHALILIMVLEFFVLKRVLILGLVIRLNSSAAFRVFLFIVIIAGAAGLGVAVVRLMVRTCGDDSLRIYI